MAAKPDNTVQIRGWAGAESCVSSALKLNGKQDGGRSRVWKPNDRVASDTELHVHPFVSAGAAESPLELKSHFKDRLCLLRT